MGFSLTHSEIGPFRRTSAPGARPGTIVARANEPKPVISVMAFSNGELVEKTNVSVAELKELTETYAVTWINVEGLGDADVLRELGEMFGLHNLALEDTINVHQRPKVEDYGEHLFIVARMIRATERLQTEQICFFVGQKFVLTIQEGKPGDCLDPVRERIRTTTSRLRHGGTDYLTYALLDSIIDHYFPVVELYGEHLDTLDDSLIRSGGDASVNAIQKFRSELLFLRRNIRPHRELINSLLRDEFDIIGDNTRVYLRDLYDHTVQLADAIDTYREICSDLRDYHLAAVSNRTNDVMKTLTIIATIFIPLSFIAGLYGMNFEDMPELHWRYGYYAVLALMGAVVVALLSWFHRKGWFGA